MKDVSSPYEQQHTIALAVAGLRTLELVTQIGISPKMKTGNTPLVAAGHFQKSLVKAGAMLSFATEPLMPKGAYRGLFQCKFCGARHSYPEDGYTTRNQLENWSNEPTDICPGSRPSMKAPHWEPLVNGAPMLNKHQFVLIEIINKNDDLLA